MADIGDLKSLVGYSTCGFESRLRHLTAALAGAAGRRMPLMQTETRIVASDEDGLEAAAALLKRGGVAVIPTDTVYGLAAHPSFPCAVARLYTIKARDAAKPVAMLAADAAAVAAAGFSLSAEARKLADEFWPGPLTLVLPSAADPSRLEGFRVPDHSWTRRLLAACGGLLRVTSANMSGCRPASDAHAALREVGLAADLVVDGGRSPGGVPSSVFIQLPSGALRLARTGPVPPPTRT